MTPQRPLTARWVTAGINLAIVVTAAVTAYYLTHGYASRLSDTIRQQREKLVQQQQWRALSHTPQSSAKTGAELAWQLAEWADSLDLKLTLQPLTADHSVVTLYINGTESGIRQLLKRSREYSDRGAWQNVWQSQLLTWKQLKGEQAGLQWQLTTNLASPALKPLSVQAPTSPLECEPKPLPATKHYPSLDVLELSAIVIAERGSPTVFWRTPTDQQLKTHIGAQFGQSGDRLAAAVHDHVIIQRWHASGDCWLMNERTITL